MRKRMFALFMAMLMCLSLLPFGAVADAAVIASGTDGNITWTLDENGLLTIGGEGAMENYSSISYSGTYATSAPWGQYYASIKSVVIEDGVTRIGNSAFAYCSGLTSVTIPDSVTSIGSSAFDGTALYNNSSNWENGVLYLGKYLIVAKTNITSCSVKAGTLCIADSAFNRCSSLTSVTIPDSVTSIGSAAFSACIGITSVDIPDSVTSIGREAFYYCSSLTSVTIPDNVTSIGSAAFYYCYGLTSAEFEGNAPTIFGTNVFYHCASGFKILAPDNDTWKGAAYDAEAGTWNGYPIEFYYVAPAIIDSGECGENLTWTLDENGLLTISGEGSMPNYNWNTMPWYRYSFSIYSAVIGDGVTSIGNYAFYNCSRLTSVTIPDSVQSIGSDAFEYCRSLTSVTIPDSVQRIGNYAFFYCDSLTSVDITEGVTALESKAFASCANLQAISLPSTIEDFSEAFWFDSLSTVNYNGSIGNWNEKFLFTYSDYAFKDADIICTDGTISPESVIAGRISYPGSGYWAIVDNTLYISGSGTLNNDPQFSSHWLDKVIIGEGITCVNYLPNSNTCEFPSTLERIDDGDFYPYNLYSYNGTVAEWNDVDIPDGFKGIAVKCSDGYANVNYSCGDNATWSYENGVITVSGTGEISDRNWRFLKDEATALVINEGIQGISALGFGCDFSKLAEISFPDSLEYVDSNVPLFGGTPYAEDPDNYIGGVLYIDKWAIACDHTEADIVIRDGTVGIGPDAFYELAMFDGTEIESVCLPEGIKFIGEEAFAGCDRLETINLPDSITSIGYMALAACGIKELRLPAGVTAYEGYDNSFLLGTPLEKLTIPNTVKKIGPEFPCWSVPDNLEFYYEGTEEEWNAIEIDPDNDVMLNAVIHFVPTVHVHSYVAAVTEPTCTEGGYTTYTCSCGESYVGDETEALGHDFHNLRCSRCGESQVTETARQVTEVVNQVVETFQAIGTAISNAFTNAINAIRSIFRF